MTIKRNVQDAWARYKIGVIEAQIDDLGGFDPNEDPVIIGSGAAGAAGSTPSAPNSGDTGSVILGLNATVDSSTTYYGDVVAIGHGVLMGGSGLDVSRSIAIGYGATMTDQHSVAVGDGSNVSNYNAVALGSFASVSGSYGIAIGRQSTANSDYAIAIGNQAYAHGATGSVAIGRNATNAYSVSVALGTNATCTADNQIMLGTYGETVVMPGNFDAGALPTTNPGAGSGLVWNNGGVLTVA